MSLCLFCPPWRAQVFEPQPRHFLHSAPSISCLLLDTKGENQQRRKGKGKVSIWKTLQSHWHVHWH
jgi:hypothetical protein